MSLSRELETHFSPTTQANHDTCRPALLLPDSATRSSLIFPRVFPRHFRLVPTDRIPWSASDLAPQHLLSQKTYSRKRAKSNRKPQSLTSSLSPLPKTHSQPSSQDSNDKPHNPPVYNSALSNKTHKSSYSHAHSHDHSPHHDTYHTQTLSHNN